MNLRESRAVTLSVILFLCVCVVHFHQTAAADTGAPATQPAADVTIGDMTMHTSGPYTAFLCPFNAKKFKVTGTESATITPNFPAGTALVWSWPMRPIPTVIGFLQVAGYGNYYNTIPQSPIAPQQVNRIKTLSVSHDLAFSGTDNGFNVIYDYFLTQTANGNDNHLFEIEVFVHTSGFATNYVHSVKQIGTPTISGIQWLAVIDTAAHPPDILFMPANQSDLPAGTIDLKAMHDYLVSKGKITGTEYYNGHSLGVETGQGDGKLTVKSVSVKYDWSR